MYLVENEPEYGKDDENGEEYVRKGVDEKEKKFDDGDEIGRHFARSPIPNPGAKNGPKKAQAGQGANDGPHDDRLRVKVHYIRDGKRNVNRFFRLIGSHIVIVDYNKRRIDASVCLSDGQFESNRN